MKVYQILEIQEMPLSFTVPIEGETTRETPIFPIFVEKSDAEFCLKDINHDGLLRIVEMEINGFVVAL